MLVLPYREAVGRAYGIKRHGSESSNPSIVQLSVAHIFPPFCPLLSRFLLEVIHPLLLPTVPSAMPLNPIFPINSPAGVLNPSPTSLNHRFVLVLTFFPPIDSNQVHHERERERKARVIVDDYDITCAK
jgi:hypothetical protein